MKKGSKEAKAWGRKMKRLRNLSSPRKRKATTKLKNSRVVKRRRYTKKKVTKKRPVKFNTSMAIIGGGLYGAGRQKISSMIAPFTEKIPGGIYADNLAMGIVSYLAMKKGGKLPMGKYIKEAGKAGLYAESVLAGVDVGSKYFGPSGTTNPYFS